MLCQRLTETRVIMAAVSVARTHWRGAGLEGSDGGVYGSAVAVGAKQLVKYATDVNADVGAGAEVEIGNHCGAHLMTAGEYALLRGGADLHAPASGEAPVYVSAERTDGHDLADGGVGDA